MCRETKGDNLVDDWDRELVMAEMDFQRANEQAGATRMLYAVPSLNCGLPLCPFYLRDLGKCSPQFGFKLAFPLRWIP